MVENCFWRLVTSSEQWFNGSNAFKRFLEKFFKQKFLVSRIQQWNLKQEKCILLYTSSQKDHTHWIDPIETPFENEFPLTNQHETNEKLMFFVAFFPQWQQNGSTELLKPFSKRWDLCFRKFNMSGLLDVTNSSLCQLYSHIIGLRRNLTNNWILAFKLNLRLLKLTEISFDRLDEF